MQYKTTIITLSSILMVLTMMSFLMGNPSKNSPKTNNHATVDAFMENMAATIFDKNGRPKIKLFTTKMSHYSENDSTDFEAPRLILFRESPYPWLISSDRAKAEKGIDIVNFQDHVFIQHQTNPDTARVTTIKTDSLKIHTVLETADTEAPIMMTQPELTVNAVGMHANMKTGDITLLSESRGEYVARS